MLEGEKEDAVDDDNTVWQPVEPTTPVQKYPYEPTVHAPNPYEDYVNVPPPPPKRPRKVAITVGMAFSSAVLLFCSVFLFTWAYTYHVNTTLPTPIVRFVPVTPTAPALTPTPTIYANYSASDIMSDFAQSGRQVSGISYGETLWDWSGGIISTSHHASSSVQWIDKTDTNCQGSPCPYGLWVYDDEGTAAQVYADINSAERNLPSDNQWPAYQQGRCVLMNYSSGGPYVLLIQKYCV